ncbi:MAG TPA: type II secretion system inner membrane protein GspF [Hyphomonadaceae bacterium]|nr:type II secretion system inner membrane protein GspF [Hyphomonadaceae bacterium]HPN04312.1 type II secretion system inner membrane protein GspF [Hyphomonadaceae bacterium]
MTRFDYLAVDIDGREKHGGVDAANEQAARTLLAGKKLVPVQIRPASGAATAKRAPASSTSSIKGVLKHKDRMLVTRQLAALVGASVPVDETLSIVAQQQENPTVRKIVLDVRTSVQEGMRLADALGRHKQSFSGAYRAAVAGGERSGNLGAVLVRLADHLAREQALRSKITTAMIYPAALMLVATAVVTSLMIFVVPALVEQFKAFEGRLPFLTTALIAVSNLISGYWPILLAGLFGSVVVMRIAFASESICLAIDGMLLRMPVIGRWVKNVNASRLARSVSMLNASGLPVLESVRIARDSVPNRAMAKAVTVMGDRIEEGEPLSNAMRQSQLIPPMIIYMAVGGENSGELPAMLEKAADQLDQDFESFLQAALSLVEPAIIVLMGGIVASIVLAIMLPILQLNQLAIG